MTRRIAQRARITRVRTMQHTLAAAAAAQAQQHLRQLENSDAQLAALREALLLPRGIQSGATVARIADLADRLLAARALVGTSITGARHTAISLEQARVERHIAQAGAEKLQDRAQRQVRQAQAARPTARPPHRRSAAITTKDTPQ